MAVICTVCLTSLQVVNVLVGRTFCVYIPNTRSFLEELPVVELKLCRGCIHGEEQILDAGNGFAQITAQLHPLTVGGFYGQSTFCRYARYTG